MSSLNELGSEQVAVNHRASSVLVRRADAPSMRRAAAISGVLTLTLGIAAIGVHLALSGLWQSLWHETAVTAIAPQQGYAFTAPTRHPELSAHQRPSPATVLENGVPLGPSNAQHADIRSLGRGRFSFW